MHCTRAHYIQGSYPFAGYCKSTNDLLCSVVSWLHCVGATLYRVSCPCLVPAQLRAVQLNVYVSALVHLTPCNTHGLPEQLLIMVVMNGLRRTNLSCLCLAIGTVGCECVNSTCYFTRGSVCNSACISMMTVNMVPIT